MTCVRRGRWWMSAQMAVLVAMALLAMSCAHPLAVKNIGLYKPTFTSSQQRTITVGLSASTASPEEERLVLAVTNAMKRDGFRVTYPFFPTEESLPTVEYLVKVTTSSEYKGSGWNFLINWPGFLIWTPAWHGYRYRALYGFDVDITDTKTNTTLPRQSISVDLDIRHADMGRTWTEISWLEWSAIAFIGGLIFTRYDTDVTPLLVDATEHKIGDYVASKIAGTLSSA